LAFGLPKGGGEGNPKEELVQSTLAAKDIYTKLANKKNY